MSVLEDHFVHHVLFLHRGKLNIIRLLPDASIAELLWRSRERMISFNYLLYKSVWIPYMDLFISVVSVSSDRLKFISSYVPFHFKGFGTI